MDIEEPQINQNENLLEITSYVVGAYVSNNHVAGSELSSLIETVYATFSNISGKNIPIARTSSKPAVSIKKSIHDEYLICLEDGKKFKTLKRHLRSHYNMTPEDYKSKWGLPADYPMVAPGYAKKRSSLALELGLGRKPGTKIKK